MIINLLFQSNGSIEKCNKELQKIYAASLHKGSIIMIEDLQKRFDTNKIHTACIKGEYPSIRKFKDCRIVTTSIKDIFLIVKDDAKGI